MSLGLLVACVQPPRRWKPSAASDWWASQVVCVTIEEVAQQERETEHVRYYVLADGHEQRTLKTEHHDLYGQPDHLLEGYLDNRIVAFVEQRQRFWAYQPDSWATYHVATIFEVECPHAESLFICIERVDDKLEIMLGRGSTPRSFMTEIRATGKCRKADHCFRKTREVVAPRVTVRRLLEWLGHNLARRWQPYHILQSNCQHLAEDLQTYVRDPKSGTASRPMPEELDADELILSYGLGGGSCFESPLPACTGPAKRVEGAQGAMMRTSSFGASGPAPRAGGGGAHRAKVAPQHGASTAMQFNGCTGCLRRATSAPYPGASRQGRPSDHQACQQGRPSHSRQAHQVCQHGRPISSRPRPPEAGSDGCFVQ